MPTHLSGPSSEVGTGPAFGVSTLANGTWAACIVSPRAVSMPAALATASWSAAKSAGRDGLVDQQRDVELVDGAGRDLGAGDLLVDAEVGVLGLALVVRVGAAAGRARRVGRDVGAGAGGAAGGGAAAAQASRSRSGS